jgi:outer membrane protein assembly factor BamB
MMKELGVSQHNMANCSVTCAGDTLFVCTSNGVDDAHLNLPAPNAPSFIALDRNTGRLVWQDNSPGANVLHGQWSSPAYAVLGGEPQVIFAGGDGWLYSFNPLGDGKGNSKLLWKFDCNPKQSRYKLTGSDRNHIIALPLIHDGLVYLPVGEDPEHGEGQGHLWCIDPTRCGDVSSELALDVNGVRLPQQRDQAVIPEQGDRAVPNPNSAVVWHYVGFDTNGDGKRQFEETMHRTIASVAIQDGLLVAVDFSGLVHCLDAKTGNVHWTHDLLASSWNTPLIAEGKIYITDEDGTVSIFELSPKLRLINEVHMSNSIYAAPIVANNVLYVATQTHLFAIAAADGQNENRAGSQ